VFLIVLLATRWTDSLRDLAYRMGFQNYSLSLFIYVLLLLGISKVLGIGLDYYAFRVERGYKLSNQRFGAWLWDDVKGFLVGLVLGSIVVELLYLTIRQWPQNWWMLAWALFMGLFILLAQLAPVLLFPIFYKFEPLDDEDLKRRLIMLGQRAGTQVRRLSLETIGKEQEGQRRPYRPRQHPKNYSG
jgi:STE24 endopeptidase